MTLAISGFPRWSAFENIREIAESPTAQFVLGLGFGAVWAKLSEPLVDKVITFLGVATTLPDPFQSLSFFSKVLHTPLVCIVAPIVEEMLFRGTLQEKLRNSLQSFYSNLGFSEAKSTTAARVTSVFFQALIFGLVHFTNAISFWCNPILFLPQVIAATIGGLVMGLAKEFSGDLILPIGIHMGNNIRAWAPILFQKS